MCLLLREALTVGRIAMAHQFFSNELKLAEARMRIKDELSSYCVVTEPPKTTFGKVRERAWAHGNPPGGGRLTAAFVCAWQVRQTYTGKLYGILRETNDPLTRPQLHTTPFTPTQANRTICASRYNSVS